MKNIKEFIINHHKRIEDALKVIDKNLAGICFIVNEQQQLIGSVTDGDIRRGLLAGCTIQSPIGEVMNKEVFSCHYKMATEEIHRKLNAKIRIIPIIDDQGVMVDIATLKSARQVPIYTPVLGDNELTYIIDCVKTGWISSQGSYVRKFEEQFRDLLQQPAALAVANGTVAIHLALEALGVGEGDEVILPDFTFAATINAVLYSGATPVLVDVEPDTFAINCQAIRDNITPKTKAIIPVHIYGHPCEMDEIWAIAAAFDLLVVEDCAEALGSTYQGRYIGIRSDAATFSFFGNKTITTGEGGMVVFNDEAIGTKAAVLRDHGMNKQKRYWHDMVGYNYRMTNMQAAIGVAQMERFDSIVRQKRQIAQTYHERLAQTSVGIPIEKPWATSSYWLYTILLSSEEERNYLMDFLLKNGIDSRQAFYPLHEMPIYQQYQGKGTLATSSDISRRGLSLPSSLDLTEETIQSISDLIKIALQQWKSVSV